MAKSGPSISKPIKKLYYSIGEVAKLVAVKKHVLRYWESEFSELHPAKNKAGNRTYRESDISMILEIKRLLYTEKYTLEGAKLQLKEAKGGGSTKSSVSSRVRDDALAEIRRELQELLDFLDGVSSGDDAGKQT